MATLIYSAVAVLRVANVARSAAWYAAVLGFAGDSVGSPADPVFAILHREDVELMLQKVRPGIAAPRARVQALVPDVSAIEDREYGCRELALLDPDGHVVALGECG